MGQAGSTQQHQSDQGGGAPQASSSTTTAGGEQQRRTPGRPGLHYTRSLRERHLHQQQQQNGGSSSNRESALSRFTSRDGDSKRDAAGATSPTKPRRKSLDMPDMSLSMTGTATGGTTPQSTAGTPVQQRNSIFPPRQNSSTANTPDGSAHTTPKVSLRIPHSDNNASAEDGIAMAPAAVGDSNVQSSSAAANITSPTVSSAALSPAARWARHRDGIKEGFGKKAQPVVEAAVLHAAGTSAGQASQNNNAPSLSTSPTTPFQPLSKVSSHNSGQRVKLPPVETGAHVRRSDAADSSILSAQDNDSSSAQSSGFVIRHNEVHHAPPSAPGQAVDPVHLSSLLKSGQIKEAQKAQAAAAAAASAEGALDKSSRQSSTTREKESPATSHSTVQPPHHLIFASAQDSQPPTPGGTNSYATPVPIPSPLKQPVDTILAPELPAEVPLVIPTVMPTELSHAITDSTGNPLPAMGAGPASTANDAMSSAAASADYTSPLIPGSTPPLGNPPNTLPAAAPIAALTSELAQDPKAQEAVKNATVDLGAGPDGVATLLTWKAEEETTGASGLDGTGALLSKIPSQVFVTGTFAKGWSTKIELRRNHDDPKHDKDFTALVKLPPGSHSLKFIVDKQWKTSKYLPSATDADGNLVNYLQVHKVDSLPKGQGHDDGNSDIEEDDEQWTQEIPAVLLAYGDATEAALDAQDAAREADYQRSAQSSSSMPMPNLPQLDQSHQYPTSGQNGPSSIPNVLPNPAILALQRKPLSQLQLIQPPSLPAQLEKGVLNATVLVAKGSGDDNSILPKPDHSVLNHLAASPIKGGLLSVGVTTRYRRKYVTTVYYKKPV